MQKVTNTADSQNFEWLMGGNPNAIEAQEAQGQKELVNSSQLPAKVNSPNKVNIEHQYALMGIKVIGKSKGDDLFLDVVLPDGWAKESTGHSMWNNLKDDKGRTRATFFYKAAFYDRDSFVNFSCRYGWSTNFEKENFISYYVSDSATGQKLFETVPMTKDYENPDYFKLQDSGQKECKDFLATNFPDYENINAYWD